jgi:hypothetical protein
MTALRMAASDAEQQTGQNRNVCIRVPNADRRTFAGGNCRWQTQPKQVISPTGCYVAGCHPHSEVPGMTSLRSPDLQSFLTLTEAAIRYASGATNRCGWLPNEYLRRYRRRLARPERGGGSAARLPPSADGTGERALSARSAWRPGRCVCRHRAATPLEDVGRRRHAGRVLLERARQCYNRRLGGTRDTARCPDRCQPHGTGYAISRPSSSTQGDLYRNVERQWHQTSGPWHEPGIGCLVYNHPNVVHAMRSTEQPLLALSEGSAATSAYRPIRANFGSNCTEAE